LPIARGADVSTEPRQEAEIDSWLRLLVKHQEQARGLVLRVGFPATMLCRGCEVRKFEGPPFSNSDLERMALAVLSKEQAATLRTTRRVVFARVVGQGESAFKVVVAEQGGQPVIRALRLAEADRVRFRCPHCNKPVGVPVQHAGKQGKCPGCQSVFAVPFPNDYTPDAPPPPAPAPPRPTATAAAAVPVEPVLAACDRFQDRVLLDCTGLACTARIRVEVGKRGARVHCPGCGTWVPIARQTELSLLCRALQAAWEPKVIGDVRIGGDFFCFGSRAGRDRAFGQLLNLCRESAVVSPWCVFRGAVGKSVPNGEVAGILYPWSNPRMKGVHDKVSEVARGGEWETPGPTVQAVASRDEISVAEFELA
jgi:hypothetical protein